MPSLILDLLRIRVVMRNSVATNRSAEGPSEKMLCSKIMVKSKLPLYWGPKDASSVALVAIAARGGQVGGYRVRMRRKTLNFGETACDARSCDET